ncbi:hypothetical protein QE152_g39360 [Popillia japonica]|uniref:Uncharacterized protein n=1 Tax=Popillia japonica TaxID=7064 RepID=A0AAW1HUS2_POPJA
MGLHSSTIRMRGLGQKRQTDVWERKMQRRVFGRVREDEEQRRGTKKGKMTGSLKSNRRSTYEEKQEYFQTMLAVESDSDESQSEACPGELFTNYLPPDESFDSDAENMRKTTM